MIIVQTPFRMSFFGGGTDMPEFYIEHGGKVLSTTFDKYCYHTVRYFPPFFEHKSQLTYSKIERFDNADEVEHPAVRETMKYLGMKDIAISYDADLPARSGLGTSSSFTVGLLNGFHSLRGEFVDKMTLAKEAIHVERELCGEKGGVQDQLAAAFGGFNKMEFTSDGFSVDPVIVSAERKQMLCSNLMMFFTGFVRYSGEIAEKQISRTGQNIENLMAMKKMVDDGEKILTGKGDIDDFGRLLNEAWMRKKLLADAISNSDIDSIYDSAMRAGALGGKLLGAGAGGFLLMYVQKEKQPAVRKALEGLLEIPFQFENSGTKVIFYRL